MSAISPIAHILEGATAGRDGASTRAEGGFLPLGTAGRIRAFRFASLGLVLLIPLVVVPGLEQPFSRPKLILWAAVVLCGLLGCARGAQGAWGRLPRHFRVALALWIGALGCSALWGKFASLDCLLLPLIGVGWFVLLLTVRPEVPRLCWALAFSGSAVAALALAQFFHADPLAGLGWVAASNGNSRMLVFATLGNPDFVAAFLAGLLPLTFSLASGAKRCRWLWLGLSGLQLTAILATGSRAPILGLGAVLLWTTRLNARRLTRMFTLGGVSLVVLAAGISPARNLSTTTAGRSYIWRVSAPHLSQHLLLGLGPGGFAASFPAWEVQYWSGNPDDRDRRFAAVEDHAHNDYLEIVADYGLAGVFGFLAVLAAFLRSGGAQGKRHDNGIPRDGEGVGRNRTRLFTAARIRRHERYRGEPALPCGLHRRQVRVGLHRPEWLADQAAPQGRSLPERRVRPHHQLHGAVLSQR
ncbi:MAG: O-antigen ligase family protein [Terriglobales bacterium]